MGYYGKKIIRIMIPYLAVLLISMVLGFIPDGRWIRTFLVYAGYYEIFPDCTAVLAVAADDKE